MRILPKHLIRQKLYDASYDAMRFELSFLKQKLDELTKLDERIMTLQSEVEDMEEEDILTELEENNDTLKTNMARIFEIESYLSESNHSLSSSRVSSVSTKSHVQNSARLPKLDLIHFDGSGVRKWNEFFDTFNSEIHDRTDMDNGTKFRYLSSLLHGVAKDRIALFQPSNSSYMQAYEKLHHDFGDEQKIMNAHIDALNSIKAADDSGSDLSRFLDAVKFDVEQLGFSSSTYGPFILPALMSKIPLQLRMKLLDLTAGKHPKLDKFLSFFDLEVRKREELNFLEEASLSSQYEYQPLPVSKMAAVARKPTTFTYKPKNRSYCNSSAHTTHNCTLSDEEKLKTVKTKRLCFNCSGSHNKRDCKSRGRCAKCSKAHQTSLHSSFSNESRNTQDRQSTTRTDSEIPHRISSAQAEGISNPVSTAVSRVSIACAHTITSYDSLNLSSSKNGSDL